MDSRLTEYVLKHNKKHDKELKYDFMPSLLEIVERPAHKAGTVIIYSVFTILIVAIVWASLSKLDVVIVANGNVQPIGNINSVQSFASGMIQSIKTHEGAHVNKDDILIELDTNALEIDENYLNSQMKLLETQKSIYQMIIEGEDTSVITVEEYSEAQKPYIHVILDTDTCYRNTVSNLEKEKENAKLDKQIAQLQLKQYQIDSSEIEVQKQSLIVQQYDIIIRQIELQISDTKMQYSIQINTQISQINSQLEEMNSELKKYKISKEYQSITAPVSGYVSSVNVNTVGETVSSAQELVTIVPDDVSLEFVCYVKNQDIADIDVGMEAELKLEAYPYSKYGTVNGRIKYISPSSFTSEKYGNVYIIKIEMTDYNENIEIITGLSGIVEIKVGKQTVMDYFLEPIIKGFGESLKEK